MKFYICFFISIISFNAYSGDELDVLIQDVYSEIYSYIPTSVTGSNCDYRSVYISAELAIRDIPSQEIYIQQCFLEKKTYLKSLEGEDWRYHVAPVINMKGELRVIDPSISSKTLTVRGWVKNSIDIERSPKFHIDLDAYSENRTNSNICPPSKSANINLKVQRFYEPLNFIWYCQVMRDDIMKEKKSDVKKNEKIGKLIKKTEKILETLFTEETITSSFKTPEWKDQLSKKCFVGTGRSY